MNTTIENHKGQQFVIETYFANELKSHGQWNITCEVTFKGQKKTFRKHTTDSLFIDEIAGMRSDNASWDDIQNAYKQHAFDDLEEIILEWCEDVNEQEVGNA
jgi:hypothetical protein